MKQYITSNLDRVSMYRLMSIALSVLFGVTLGFCIVGILDFSPLAVLASAAVLVGVTFVSNRLFARLFTVTAHDESSYITALILFFIFTPTLSIGGLLALGLLSVIASASKYVLAVRERHIFNPAAIAAIIISLMGLAFATWWVATPSLLPATLLLSFLILYKTRHLVMGLVFVTVAMLLIIITSLSYGASVPELLQLLVAFPLIFFVGFMLSEPLTLPPKQWQQYVIAAVAGILIALPFSIGPITSSPAIALVVANVIGLIFSYRTTIKLTLQARRALTPTVDELEFTKNTTIPFEPGQYMEITVPHTHKDGRGLRRAFSIASSPMDATVRFGVKFYEPSSTFKTALRALEPGTKIHGTMVSGSFTLPKDPTIPLVFIAGGIGITPFISHLLSLKALGQNRDIILVYAVNSLKEIAYAEVLRTLNISVAIVTTSDAPLPVSNWAHYNMPRITQSMLRKAVPDITNRIAYVSGPPIMVDIATSYLKKLKAKKIKQDYFTGY